MFPFSQRNKPVQDSYILELPKQVRLRILHTVQDKIKQRSFGTVYDFNSVISEVGNLCLKQYGGLWNSRNVNIAEEFVNKVINHFLDCSDEIALDFIEFFFHVSSDLQRSDGVDVVNNIFREEAIGYELTPYREEDDGPGMLYGHLSGRKIKQTFPQIIRKSENYLHEEVVRPALVALATPGFDTANTEMLRAHEAYRRGVYSDALTHAGSAFESVLKIICSKKGWKYQPEKDTLAPLITACQTNGLFPPFYAEVFKASGIIRNKLSSSHGRATTQTPPVTQEFADHMIQTTSSHITFLIKQAGF